MSALNVVSDQSRVIEWAQWMEPVDDPADLRAILSVAASRLADIDLDHTITVCCNVTRALRDLQPRQTTCGREARGIVAQVASEHGLTTADLYGPRRTRDVAWPRQEAIWRVHQLGKHSLPAIGALFNRDHTTVLHSIRAYEKRLAQDVAEPPVDVKGDAAFLRHMAESLS